MLVKDDFFEALFWSTMEIRQTTTTWQRRIGFGKTGKFTKRLEKIGTLEEYHQIMKEQLNARIIEPVSKFPTGEVMHYILHQPVIKESAESPKLWIMYDCTARGSKDAPSSTAAIWHFVEEQDAISFHHWWYKKSISTNQIERIAQVCTTTSLRSSLWWSLKKKHRRVSVHQSDIWVSRSFYPQHLLSKACRAIQRGVSWKNRSIIRRYLRTRHTIKWRLFQRVGQIQRGINKDYGCRWIWAE